MYLLLLALIYLTFVSLGLPDPLLGAGWPAMHQALKAPLPYMGMVSMIISGGTILSSILSARLTRRLGTRGVTVLSVFLTAAALFGFSASTRFYHLCLWAIPYGLGAGAIDAALNNYVAAHYSSRHMNWLHCFWGVGTIVSPYIMGYALTKFTWNRGYQMVGALQLVIGCVLLLTLPVWNVNRKADQTDGGRVLSLRETLAIPGVKLLLTGFFAYCAAEATVMLWASSYLVVTRGVSAEDAASLASLFFLGLTGGRFAAGFLSDRLGDHNMIRLGTGILFLGIVCVMLPVAANALAFAGFIIIGIGCAPIYPSIIHATPAHFGAENARSVIGIQMASAYLGSTLMPPVFGLIANYVSMRLLPVYLLVFFALMIGLIERLHRTVQSAWS